MGASWHPIGDEAGWASYSMMSTWIYGAARSRLRAGFSLEVSSLRAGRALMLRRSDRGPIETNFAKHE
jgi:hypothetical protein